MFKGKNTSLILGILLVGILGGTYAYSRGQQPVMTEVELEEEAMMASDSAILDHSLAQESESYLYLSANEATLTGDLVAVGDFQGSGTAYVLREEGALYHYVIADLPDPAEGSVYEGWLVSKTPTLEFFSTGIMQKVGNSYVIDMHEHQEFAGYNDVVITLETVVDDTPETHVLEGVAK